jgi:hypothetical protein
VETALVTASNVIITNKYFSYKKDEYSNLKIPIDNNTIMYVISAIFTNRNEPTKLYHNYCELPKELISERGPTISYFPTNNFACFQYFSAVQNNESGELILYPIFTIESTGDSTYRSFGYKPVYLLCDIDGDGQIELIIYMQGSNSLRTWLHVYELKRKQQQPLFIFGYICN